MKLYRALVVLVSLPLAGCTTGLAMKAMNGIGMCPPGAIAGAQQVASTLSYVNTGDSVGVLDGLVVERRMDMDLRGGDMVSALMYRTGHPRCRNMPTEEEFTPVMVRDWVIVGIGMDEYQRFQSMAVRVSDVTPRVPEVPMTFSRLYKSLPF